MIENKKVSVNDKKCISNPLNKNIKDIGLDNDSEDYK